MGDILFRPTTQEPSFTNEFFYSPANFSHQDEMASAGYYSVLLKDEGIKAELTATPHVGMHRYTYLTGNLAAVIVDMAHSLDNEYIYEAELENCRQRNYGYAPNQGMDR